ncbi:hypothetical protein [Nocardia puris]|uniref:Uncharacterized protein n=1 Tax=Nocardia puris TaxID=208602 RepID=A0A366CY24_9NOCA|nr:hypothetical protein [Nocardia puris]RBO82109.1 hypothetical protein DFR74_12564 [Nocardia puris]
MTAEFVDELPPTSGRRRLAEFATELREQPGRWARWPNPIYETSAISIASKVRRGQYRAFPGGEFEAEHRDGVVYARYVGGES